MSIRFDHRLVSESDGIIETGTAYAPASVFAASARVEGLSIETSGPISLLPNGQKCGLHFAADATVTIVLGTTDYGQGLASSYFANLLVDRLGIPCERIRVYYTGGYPAVRRKPRHAPHIRSRADVYVATAKIGDIIEALCDRVIEQGCHLLGSLVGVLRADLDFEASSGRFFVVGKGQYFHILDLARRTRNSSQD